MQVLSYNLIVYVKHVYFGALHVKGRILSSFAKTIKYELKINTRNKKNTRWCDNFIDSPPLVFKNFPSFL